MLSQLRSGKLDEVHGREWAREELVHAPALDEPAKIDRARRAVPRGSTTRGVAPAGNAFGRYHFDLHRMRQIVPSSSDRS
ncbi:MAG: hypothetical protein QOF70_7031 [Acetobacteraceae bacterium]|jgi:hypothetical protein|nr:hypothetical protein [Acetobacteraceae bacterium]